MCFLCMQNQVPLSTTVDTPMHPHQIEEALLKAFRFDPTAGQRRLFHAFSRFAVSDKSRCALLLKGYAGTGKTTCVGLLVHVIEKLGLNYVLLAPTGRAARVLANYSNRSASTIHRHIYYAKQTRTGEGVFELKENELTNTIFMVDEASMIGHATGEPFNDLLDDLISHVYSGENCKLLIIGDSAQLPPVGSAESPALQLSHLKSSYYLNIAEVELSEVIRQQEGSGILQNATGIRNLISKGDKQLPQLRVDSFEDVNRIESDLQDYLENAFSAYGKDDMIVITRSNKRANLFNQQIRQRILWLEEEINAGDRMMVLKNNYYWIQPTEFSAGFIANGDTLEIKRVLRFEDRNQFRFCKAIVRMPDYPDMPEFETILLCNTIWDNHASLPTEERQALARLIAEDYSDITDNRLLQKAVKNDPYYNALQVKFSYAITCHKAQGGQWPCVFVDQGYINDEMAGIELNRWFYTAFTRAQEKLYLVGFEEQFFES
jgi:ATP-dependent exoDNAse (exonuclease V) alpha subunit